MNAHNWHQERDDERRFWGFLDDYRVRYEAARSGAACPVCVAGLMHVYHSQDQQYVDECVLCGGSGVLRIVAA